MFPVRGAKEVVNTSRNLNMSLHNKQRSFEKPAAKKKTTGKAMFHYSDSKLGV